MTGEGADVVSLFVLGDLHFPEFIGERTNVDIHDHHPPGDIPGSLELPLTAVVKDSLVAQIAASSSPVVLICGDITSRGDIDQYEHGLKYLADLLTDPSINAKLPPERIHIVPGNHDIAFKSPQGAFTSIDDTTRFEDIRQIVAATMGDLLAVDSRQTQPAFGDKALNIISINTCLGSGAPRSFALDAFSKVAGAPATTPPTMGTPPVGADPAARGRAPAEDEVLDVPLVHPRELGAIDAAFANSDYPLRVVLAHHALLPQHIPRLNPYTEMVNAGQARHALTALRKPLLYVHGHIHADVVEVIRVPNGLLSADESAPLICISAPELRHGYHRVDVHYRPNGEPVGVEVTTWHLEPGAIRMAPAMTSRRIALAAPEPISANRRRITQHIAEAGMARGDELIAFGARVDPPISAHELELELESMVWSGFLALTDITSRPPFDSRGYRIV